MSRTPAKLDIYCKLHLQISLPLLPATPHVTDQWLQEISCWCLFRYNLTPLHHFLIYSLSVCKILTEICHIQTEPRLVSASAAASSPMCLVTGDMTGVARWALLGRAATWAQLWTCLPPPHIIAALHTSGDLYIRIGYIFFLLISISSTVYVSVVSAHQPILISCDKNLVYYQCNKQLTLLL